MYLVIGGGGFLGGYLIKNIINTTKKKFWRVITHRKGVKILIESNGFI